jgi:hypothetical protein
MAKYKFIKTTKALNDAAELIVKSLKSRLEENFSDASGDLGNSISLTLKSSGNKIEASIFMLDYWGAVDKGRKAGKRPPIDKIREWLTYPNPRAKLGLDGSLSSTEIRVTTNKKGERKVVSSVDGLAFLIARKIGEKGTKGNNFASDVFDSDKVKVDLPNAILDAVVFDADSVLTELLDSFS